MSNERNGTMSGTRWERWTGVAGLVFVAAIVATFFVPTTPDIGAADAELGPAIAADARGLGAGVYLLGLAGAAFAVFATGLAGRIRSGEGERAGSSIAVVVGAVLFTTMLLVSSGVTLALTAAARENRDSAAIRALFELDEVLFIPAGFGLAVCLLSAAVGILSTRTLPAWLGWTAGLFGAGYLVALLGVMSADDEGGPLGAVFFIDLMLSMLWILAAAVALLLEPRPTGVPAARRVAAPSV
jgi:hypothetical protein